MKKYRIRDIISACIFTVVFFTIALTIFLFRFANVPTDSMVPTINVGDTLIYSPYIGLHRINKDDIIIYNSEDYGRLVVHRVVDIKYVKSGDTFVKTLTLKGDNNSYKDNEQVSNDKYIGKVVKIVKNKTLNKIFSGFVNMTSTKRVILLSVLTIIGIAEIILSIIRERRKML